MQMETAFAVPFLKRDDETLYDYCLSFSPAAPFFGVPWRFAAGLKVAAFKTPEAPAAPVDVAQAMVDEAVEVTEEVAESLEAAVEAMAESITAKATLVAAPADDAPVDVPAAPVETAQADLLGAASAAPEGLLDTPPAVIDDLKLIKGVGPKLEAELNGLGIYTFAQIAAMTEPQMTWLDEQISSVRGRPMRDDWAGQAKALAG